MTRLSTSARKQIRVEKLARMSHEEANRRLSLSQHSGYSNFFSSSIDGKANSRRASPRAGPAAAPPHLSPPPGGGSQLDADSGVTVEC